MVKAGLRAFIVIVVRVLYLSVFLVVVVGLVVVGLLWYFLWW